ncbi:MULTISPECIES: DUF4825 domain-containing protein [Gracilibacillus]|uniref:DUF4825 domain-containing protein n=1 Tax=Gracilibacillus TaxID=74385 RepID=UPI0008250BB1|nr:MULTISPECIES: DUF4825 domain-containing protein [Gracilibacillus]
MKKLILTTAVLLCITFILSACQSLGKEQGIFQWNDSFVGDNNAISSIVFQLPNADSFESMELQTKEEPYEIILHYQEIMADNLEQEYQYTAFYNATFLFTLVQNVEKVTFAFKDESYTLTRTELEKWYDTKLGDLNNEKEVKQLIESHQEESATWFE